MNGACRTLGREYCRVWYSCYATNARRNMSCLVTAGEHANIRGIARQQRITTREELLETVFSVGSSPRPYNEDLRSTKSVDFPVWRRGRISPP
jgi:hypothetical protein